MFRNTRLIFAILLSGCATAAGDSNPPNFTPTKVEETINTTLLETVETTLEVADLAIDEILEDKIEKQNKIYSLQKLINKEEKLILNLEGSLDIKDSLLLTYEMNNQLLEEKIDEVENNLNHALHKCGNECYPTITRLNQENQNLLTYIDSLQNQVQFLDSLISTNKKLSKQLASY